MAKLETKRSYASGASGYSKFQKKSKFVKWILQNFGCTAVRTDRVTQTAVGKHSMLGGAAQFLPKWLRIFIRDKILHLHDASAAWCATPWSWADGGGSRPQSPGAVPKSPAPSGQPDGSWFAEWKGTLE